MGVVVVTDNKAIDAAIIVTFALMLVAVLLMLAT